MRGRAAGWRAWRRIVASGAQAALGLALLAACAATGGGGDDDGPPRLGGAASSRSVPPPGEGGIRAEVGGLPVTVLLPPGAGPFPMVVMLHGCNGLRPNTWARWVRPWAVALHTEGIGVAVVDSFMPRGIDQVCTRGAAAWARQRANDAHGVRAWLAAAPYARADRIAVMGMSNGGRTVLAALRSLSEAGPPPDGQGFRAGVALYPGCQSDTDARFAAPILVLIGTGDTVTPARFCEALRDAQPPGAPPVTLVLYPNALHSFDVDLPERRYLGMQLGGDAAAAADARHRVLAFLAAQGMGR
ncbi:prolyl oligopeptidase family serine peptidase [Roseomonas hellenica]|uniref:Prolyl oligopeptidase family serine peptidase n=1 Tax=Plastoroseomonas hellenica TaxID=2687306 RepID=A0ABS5F144_9PROT|nr:dienelactone hydrolase family protein [Plastoroseomonas hellenica]MBR0666267.1 prolyl oligopeptidase family serine peptidase [Plastoroseomonas hellenica]